MFQALNETKKNYEIYDWELLAIMTEFKQQCHYLADSKFKLWSDHKNLKYFKRPQKLNWQQAQQFSEIQDYNFDLIHKLESTIRKVDTLSRQPDFNQGRLNNKEKTIFKIRPIQLYKVDKEDKRQKELEDIEKCIEKEVKRMVKSKEKEWRKEGKVIFQKE